MVSASFSFLIQGEFNFNCSCPSKLTISSAGIRIAAGQATNAIKTWVQRQPPKMKAFLTVISAMAVLMLLYPFVHNYDNLIVAAEAIHSIGISILLYKLIKEKTCAGLSLKSQELTAIFLAVRLYCSFILEYNIHTLLDLAALITTLWVIYMIRLKLRSSYMEEKEEDNFELNYAVVPCAVLALLIHIPSSTSQNISNMISWSFWVYLEAVSVLPQLRVLQNMKKKKNINHADESFTGNCYYYYYVFALVIARFLNFAPLVFDVLDGRGYDLVMYLVSGVWPSMVLISDIVKNFILAKLLLLLCQRFHFGGSHGSTQDPSDQDGQRIKLASQEENCTTI